MNIEEKNQHMKDTIMFLKWFKDEEIDIGNTWNLNMIAGRLASKYRKEILKINNKNKENMKTRKCLGCKTRITQHEYKTTHEKEYCHTCRWIDLAVESIKLSVKQIRNRDIEINWEYKSK